jgi:hypothetical protein
MQMHKNPLSGAAGSLNLFIGLSAPNPVVTAGGISTLIGGIKCPLFL